MEKPHRKLRVWRDSMEFVETVYGVTSGFPSGERFGLVSQMRRCAVSIPSNIAEGAAKHSAVDYCRFLTIAIGSVAELDTQLELSRRLGFLSKEAHSRTDTKLNALSRMLVALRRSIQSKEGGWGEGR